MNPLPPPVTSLLLLAQTASSAAHHVVDGPVSIGPLTLPETVVSLVWRIVASVGTVVLALILLRLVPVLERRVIKWAGHHDLEDKSATASMIDHRQRVETLTRVTVSIAHAIIWVTTVIIVLGNLGIAIGPLIAGAGIAGVAVGFGAQSIVKDFFSGFFILLENQFDVGDTVSIGTITGTVERMTMRITVLRDATGTAYFIPNSNISNVANKTYGWGRANVDVVFGQNVPEEEVREVLSAAAERASSMPDMDRVLMEPIGVEGPVEFAVGSLTWRLTGKTRAQRGAEARRTMISALSAELRARGIHSEGSVLAVKGRTTEH